MGDADQVISRILFLEGVPNLQRYHKLRVGETVKEPLESDPQLESTAIQFLNQGIEAARKIGDNATEDLFTRILVGEEHHTDWLETQLELIRQVGEQNYLAQQMKMCHAAAAAAASLAAQPPGAPGNAANAGPRRAGRSVARSHRM